MAVLLFGFDVESVPPRSKLPLTLSKFPTVSSKSVIVSSIIELVPELSDKATSASIVPRVKSSVNVDILLKAWRDDMLE